MIDPGNRRFSRSQSWLTFLTMFAEVAALASGQTSASRPDSLERKSARLTELLRKVAFTGSVFTPGEKAHGEMYEDRKVRSASVRGCVLTLEEEIRLKSSVVRDEPRRVEPIIDEHTTFTYVIPLADVEMPVTAKEMDGKPVIEGQRTTPARWVELTVGAAQGKKFEERGADPAKTAVRGVPGHMLKLPVTDRPLANEIRDLLNEMSESCWLAERAKAIGADKP